jgi:hypothetical protein
MPSYWSWGLAVGFTDPQNTLDHWECDPIRPRLQLHRGPFTGGVIFQSTGFPTQSWKAETTSQMMREIP